MKNAMEVQGIVAAATGDPFVQLRLTDEEGGVLGQTQWTPDEARQFAQLVLEAATNATYEAALIEFLKSELKLSQDKCNEVLVAMRIWRADKWGQPQPEDWRQ